MARWNNGDLFAVDVLAEDEPGIAEHFADFHQRNPSVYAALVELARAMRARGHVRGGIGMLYEVVRWQRSMQTVDDSADWKLNNNYRSHYARLIMREEADLDGFFELRELRAP